MFGMFLKHEIPPLIIELIDRLQIIKFKTFENKKNRYQLCNILH